MPNVILIGAPIDDGQKRAGCVMGPTAYRVAGIAAAIRDMGHGLTDWGDLALAALRDVSPKNPVVHSLPQVLGWTEVLADRVDDALSEGALPIRITLGIGKLLGQTERFPPLAAKAQDGCIDFGRNDGLRGAVRTI